MCKVLGKLLLEWFLKWQNNTIWGYTLNDVVFFYHIDATSFQSGVS